MVLVGVVNHALADPPWWPTLNRPAQSASPGTGNKQSETRPIKADSNSQERGSEGAPLLVRVINDPADESKAKELAKESQNSTTNERRLADDTERLANYTLMLFLATVLLALVAAGQIYLFYRQLKYMGIAADDARTAANAALATAEATKEANALSRANFVADQRPWIKVAVEPAAPLTYQNGELVFTARFHLTNVGKSIARNVSIRPILSSLDFADGEAYNPLALQHQAVIDGSASKANNYGYSVFPSDTIIQDHTISLTAERLAKITKTVEFVVISLHGTVTYKFLFADDIHQTGFMLDIRRSKKSRPISVQKNRAPDAIFPDEGDIPREELRLQRTPLGGDYAD